MQRSDNKLWWEAIIILALILVLVLYLSSMEPA